MTTVKCLVSNILKYILFCAQQKKETYTDKGKQITDFLFNLVSWHKHTWFTF